MATPLVLPFVLDAAYQSMEVALEGVSYRIAYAWNRRTASWYLSISTAEGTALVSGLRMVLDWPLLEQHRAREPRLPPGRLFAFAIDGGEGEAGFADMGRRVKLFYYTAADVAAIQAGLAASEPAITIAPIGMSIPI